MRSIIPGYVNYFNKDVVLPAHTKGSFNEYKILTIHGIKVKSALIFLHKIKYFPESLPLSIRETLPDNAPSQNSTHENGITWLNKYGQSHFNLSIFLRLLCLQVT